MKWPCKECDYPATNKGNISRSLNTSKRYMKVRGTHAENVNTRQLQRAVSLNTSKWYIKERSGHAGILTTRQLHLVVSLHTSKRYTKERNTHVGNVTRLVQKVILVICVCIKLLRKPISRHTRINITRVEQYTGCPAIRCAIFFCLPIGENRSYVSFHIWTFSKLPGHEFSEIYHNFMFLMILGEVFIKISEWELFKIISKSGFNQ
jgi:hypothetical protein